MLKRLAILAVFLASCWSLEPIPGQTANHGGYASDEQQHQAGDSKGPDKPTITLIEKDCNSEQFKGDADCKKAENNESSVSISKFPTANVSIQSNAKRDFPDWVSFWVSFALAVAGFGGVGVGVFTVLYIKRQTSLMEKQTGILEKSVAAAKSSAAAANAQIELIKNKERAQVSIDLEELDLVYDQKRDGYPVRFMIVMDGTTRATIEHESIIAYLADSPIRRMAWEPLGLGGVFRPEASPFHGTIFIQSQDESDPFNERDIRRIQLISERKLDVYVTGKISYQDIFGDRWELGIDRIWHPFSMYGIDGCPRGIWTPAGNGQGDYHRKVEQPQNPN